MSFPLINFAALPASITPSLPAALPLPQVMGEGPGGAHQRTWECASVCVRVLVRQGADVCACKGGGLAGRPPGEEPSGE